MKASLKTLSFIFFISLFFHTCPAYSNAEEEASTQVKDRQILIDDCNKVIEVSVEDIKERLLKGASVHFLEEQEKSKMTIPAEWIMTALKKEYGVAKIDIRNALS